MKQGWGQIKVSDAVNVLNGFAFRSSKYVKSGIRVIRITNVQKGYVEDADPRYYPIDEEPNIRKYMLKGGDMLMSLTGNVGRVGVLPENLLPCALNQRVACLRVKNDRVSKRFLFYLLNSNIFEQRCIKSSQGAAQLNMSTEWLKEQVLPLPPLAEQQRIVDVLDAEFEKIDALKVNAERNLQNAKDLFQSTIGKELKPRIGWKTSSISSVSSESKSIKWKEIDEHKQFKYIDLTSVDRETKSITEPQQICKSNAPSRAQRIVQTDDVIFATTRPTLRRYCIIPDEYDGQICSTGYCVVRPDRNKVLSSWLFYVLSSNDFYDYIEPLQTGATYPAVTDKNVRGYIASFPTISEQQTIVSRLDDLNDRCKTLQENYEKTIALCEDLKQALLRKAFNGEL